MAAEASSDLVERVRDRFRERITISNVADGLRVSFRGRHGSIFDVTMFAVFVKFDDALEPEDTERFDWSRPLFESLGRASDLAIVSE